MVRQSSSAVLEPPAALPKERWTTCASDGRCRVLLIDDHPLVLDLVSHLLRHADYVVAQADGGPEGIRMLRAALPDLVLTDLRMPGASGWEVARVAKALRPPVPVVLMTGSGREAIDENPEGRALVDAVLLKPFGANELLGVVRRLIGDGRRLDANGIGIRPAVPAGILE